MIKLPHISSELTPWRWDVKAAHLLDPKGSGATLGDTRSYSAWIREFADQNKKTQASIWRAVSAGRIYRDLRDRLAKRGHRIPDLGQVPEGVSPECLELLEKISRVAPTEVVEPLELQVVAGEVPRRELRKLWEAYRPVLGGQTARGRNVVAPRFDPKDKEQVHSRLEADVVAALRQAGAAWCGCPAASLYELFLNTPPIRASRTESYALDAIAIVQPGLDDPVQLHGVEITSGLAGRPLDRRLKALSGVVEALWVALPADSSARAVKAWPEEVGVITAGMGGVVVVRPAVVCAPKPSAATESLMRNLLARALRR
ncbi:hypothetical protein [uncultured Nevskia sp.]|uniref:hypothetical protein n=1 Tax=uncultured Nevskia sp. TaxID=228950 RepID=UPI0025F82789|nr:hypothetical protein [uncultured Nevskia sp.]